jgi:hydroxymethylglutaryl-CoA reductase (NADPH)
MWPSTNRGASVSRHAGGIHAVIVDERMTRSVLLEGPDALAIQRVIADLKTRFSELAQAFACTSRFAKLIDWHTQCIGNLLFLRLEATTGDASGHNMVTKGADSVIRFLIKTYPELRYVSISGNFCVDKKVSAVNGILGRGKHVIAEINIPRQVCLEKLKTTPEAIVNLHIKKNLLGSLLAGGVRTANAHFANLLLALYLATGQDGANVVEGSQGFVHTEVRHQEDLYFSVSVPNIIVGTVGNGKHLDFVRENLAQMGCLEARESGENARRLAVIAAATVLCGELSLLAAQTNPGELMRAHDAFERGEAAYREPDQVLEVSR